MNDQPKVPGQDAHGPNSDDSLVPLDYAQRPSARLRNLRRAILILMGVGLLFVGWKWGPAGWTRAQLLYWQRLCLAHAPAADVVTFTSNPQESDKLRQDRQLYTRVNLKDGVLAAGYRPAYFDSFLRLARRAGPLASSAPLLFLGKMTDSSNQVHLVAVEYYPESLKTAPGEMFVNCAVRVWKPASWFTEAKESMYVTYVPLFPDDLRTLAPQPDPTDSSHVTMKFHLWGKDQTMDLALIPPNESTRRPSVRMTIREDQAPSVPFITMPEGWKPP